MAFDRDEIQAAFDRYQDAANEAGRTGDWGPWVDCFTPDLHYIEHMYGEFQGREAVLGWITETMTAWPFTEMSMRPTSAMVFATMRSISCTSPTSACSARLRR